MEEILVYHSKGKTFIVTLACWSMVALFIIVLYYYITDGAIGMGIFSGCIVLLYTFCGFHALTVITKEWILSQPYLRITEKGVYVDSLRKKEILFNDILSFELHKYSATWFLDIKTIGVIYKYDLKRNNINVNCIDMDVQELCDLLNERLH